MNTVAALPTRDPFMPHRPPGMRAGLALALLAHALLIAGLAFSVDWQSAEPTAVVAELWSTLPQQAAPRAVEAPAPPPPPVVRPPPPTPAPARPQPVQPPAPPQVDPQIAIEKARQASQAQSERELAEQERARHEKAQRDRMRREEVARQQQQAERDRLQAKELQTKEQQARDEQARKQQQLADKAQKAEKEKAEHSAAAAAAAQQAAARAAYLKRIQGLAGASGNSNATGSTVGSGKPSAGYAGGASAGYVGRIIARIKPNIVYPDAIDGNPTASVEVHVAPDGTITSRRLVQSSGVKSWDDAVLRAIDRTDGLPRDVDGRVQPVMLISFKPQP